jgi:hypothetical protein
MLKVYIKSFEEALIHIQRKKVKKIIKVFYTFEEALEYPHLENHCQAFLYTMLVFSLPKSSSVEKFH